jgi:hypothetical protein
MDKEMLDQLQSVKEFLTHKFNVTGDKKYEKELRKGVSNS